MNLEFLQAKDGNKIFCAQGLFYHSKYSPINEAQRFVDTLSLPFNPKIIFIIEPGIDYCSSLIRKKFNDCKTAAIRLFQNSQIDKGNFDFVIPFDNQLDFKQKIISEFGEEILLSSGIFMWPAAKNIFSQETSLIFEAFKTAIEECKTILVTRQFFEKKWLINSLNFINYANNIVYPNIHEGQIIVVCASGPSLKPCIPIIKNNKKVLFIICLSSATKVLLKNDIKPDLILTTDGGWYAGQHLKSLINYNDIPIAAPIEAYIPAMLLKNNPLIPLEYDDSSSFISTSLLQQSGIKILQARRNPTVSGTAYYFSKSFNPQKVFFCGLDLAAGKGFSHTKPNELELNIELSDNRINTKTKRTVSSLMNSSSLKIYEQWFCTLNNEENKVCRVIDSSKNSLGNIFDIKSSDFANYLEEAKTKKTVQLNKMELDKKEIIAACNKTKVYNYVLNQIEQVKWQKQLFPADFISIENALDEQKQIAQQRLNSKVQSLKTKIRKLCGE